MTVGGWIHLRLFQISYCAIPIRYRSSVFNVFYLCFYWSVEIDKPVVERNTADPFCFKTYRACFKGIAVGLIRFCGGTFFV